MASKQHVITKPEIYVDGKARPLLRWELSPVYYSSYGISKWQRLIFTYLDDEGNERDVVGRMSLMAEDQRLIALV